jgi:hypothetical protein
LAAASNRVGLREAATIRGGWRPDSRAEIHPHGGWLWVQLRDVGLDGQVSLRACDRVEPKSRPAEQTLEPGDVLLALRGRPRAAVFRHVEAALAGEGLAVIRSDATRLLPAYLAWWFSTEQAQRELRERSRGTTIPFLAMKEVLDLDLPLPPLATQQAIVTCAALTQRQSELLTELHRAYARLLTSHANRTHTTPA